MGQLVQTFKEQFYRTSPSNTSTNPNEFMDTPLSNVQELPSLKSLEESENELEIENKALLKNLEDEGIRECDIEAFTLYEKILGPTLNENNVLDDAIMEELIADELEVEEESQVMTIENVMVKIVTFTLPMDFVTWGIKNDLQNSHILRRSFPSASFLKPSMD